MSSLNLPQAAILGMHTIKDTPYVVNGEIKIRPIMVSLPVHYPRSQSSKNVDSSSQLRPQNPGRQGGCDFIGKNQKLPRKSRFNASSVTHLIRMYAYKVV
jgi:hypothetical protein